MFNPKLSLVIKLPSSETYPLLFWIRCTDKRFSLTIKLPLLWIWSSGNSDWLVSHVLLDKPGTNMWLYETVYWIKKPRIWCVFSKVFFIFKIQLKKYYAYYQLKAFLKTKLCPLIKSKNGFPIFSYLSGLLYYFNF